MTRATTRVWAPRAQRVDLQIELADDDALIGLRRDETGWWHGPTLDLDARYRFVVDGTAVPDPRAARLPDGVHGWSQMIDLADFSWTDAGWHGFDLGEAVIMEIHVGTFTDDGTYDAAIGRLAHLVGLGVNTVELMPVASFPGAHGWGYDGVGLFAVHEPSGGPRALQRFVDACHGRGLAVVIDVVYNHLGPSGNHLPKLGPYFTDHHVTPWGQAVNYDTEGSDEVRRFVVDNAVQWVRDFHADGLRLDAVHEVHDETTPHILREIAEAVHAVGVAENRTTWVIAETMSTDSTIVRPVADGGFGLDAVWNDDFHHALHVALTDERQGYYEPYEGLADLARCLNEVVCTELRPLPEGTPPRPIGDLDRGHFVVCAQNHDQIGNRAVGDRLVHLVGVRRAQIAAALVLTSPFVPLLFQGEDWGASTPFQYFTDHDDPELAAAVRDGRRNEFGAFGWDPDAVPDPQDVATRGRSVLRWDERDDEPHDGLERWHRALLGLRAAHVALRDHATTATSARADAARGWLRVQRGDVIVVVNLGGRQRIDLELDDEGPGTTSVLLSNDPTAVLDHGDHTTTIELDDDSVVLLTTSPKRSN